MSDPRNLPDEFLRWDTSIFLDRSMSCGTKKMKNPRRSGDMTRETLDRSTC